jgi:hypothetical protein
MYAGFDVTKVSLHCVEEYMRREKMPSLPGDGILRMTGELEHK